MPLPDGFGVTISDTEFADRFLTFHKQLFASTEFAFDDVTTHVFTPPEGTYQVDHSFFHDGDNWHLFYVTGDLSLSAIHTKYMAARDLENAAKHCLEPGVGHAIGKTLFDLEYTELIEPPIQGVHDAISRSNGWVFEYGGRYGMLYGVRGTNAFVGFSLLWSDDLKHWTPGDSNPVFGPPSWAPPGSTCKDVHIEEHEGVYLLYYITSHQNGYCSCALITTTDWKTFEDQGCLFQSAPMLRGTLGIESLCVVPRDDLWHLFFTYGPGLWHAISPSPARFVYPRQGSYNVGTGFYMLGHFHATETICDPDGNWWLTTDRKEETRRLNREAGRLCYRGSCEDEVALEEGLYLSQIQWNGDQPILVKPERP